MTTITIEPASTLAAALREAARTGDTVVVRAGDASYTMNVERDPPREHDPNLTNQSEAFRAAMEAASGTWDEDYAEEYKEYIRERRKSGSRPSVEV